MFEGCSCKPNERPMFNNEINLFQMAIFVIETNNGKRILIANDVTRKLEPLFILLVAGK